MLMLQGSWFRVEDLGFRVWGLRFGVWGLGFGLHPRRYVLRVETGGVRRAHLPGRVRGDRCRGAKGESMATINCAGNKPSTSTMLVLNLQHRLIVFVAS